MKKILILLTLILGSSCAMAQDNLAMGKNYYRQGNAPLGDNYFPYAVKYLSLAVEEGFGEAAYLLGDIYNRGCGMEIDVSKAAEYYKKALELGYDYGETELGAIYLTKIGDEESKEKAYELLKTAVAKGEKKAKWYMGLYFFYQEKDDVAYEMVKEDIFQIFFHSKDPYLLRMIAYFCEKSEFETPLELSSNTETSRKWKGENGVQQDYKAACSAYWETGWGGSLFRAAILMYDHDIKDIYVRRYYDVNEKWPYLRQKYVNPIKKQFYHVMAEALDYPMDDEKKRAGYYLYSKYLEDNDVPDSSPQSWGISLTRVSAMTKAAEMGLTEAQNTLADWYEQGHNVSKNLIRAREWREKAAKGAEGK